MGAVVNGERRIVILVRAEIPSRLREVFIPNNLLVLAESISLAGYEPVIIDMRVQDYKECLKSVDLRKILCAGISTLTGAQIQYGISFAAYLKSMRPEIPIVWGGPHPSLRPEETLAHPFCDYVVRGEGEVTLPELLGKIVDADTVEGIAGITYRRGDGEITSAPDREWVNLDRAGTLPYDLLDLTKYETGTTFTYHTSRGCPHRCGFCINHTFHHSKFRAQCAEHVVDNIEYIVNRFNPDALHLTDDNFFVNKKRVKDICEGILRRGIKIKWVTACRFDYFSHFDEEFLNLLKTSGCSQLGYGAESGSIRVLEYIEKGITPKDVLSSVKKARRVGLKLSPISFMYGFPGETREDLFASLDLIDRIREEGKENTVVNGMFLLTPYPGTPIADELSSRGYKFPTRLEDWSTYLMSSGHEKVNWLPPNYLRKATIASDIIRFRYFIDIHAERKLKSRLLKTAYRIFVLPFLLSEKIRWKRRLFAFAPEWRFWAHVRTKFLKVT